MKNKFKNQFNLFKKKYLTVRTAQILLNLFYLALIIVMIILNLFIWLKIVVVTIGYGMYLVLNGIFNEIQKENQKIPTVKKRFTEKGYNGAIIIDKDRFNEAILYLYEVEDKLYK